MSDDRERLQDGFARFVAAAAELERSYVALKERAAAVDLELQQTNAALHAALDERDAVFAALPIGVVVLDGRGEVVRRNPEAERLDAAARSAGIALERQPAGDVAFAGRTVRVRTVPIARGALVLLEDRSQVHELEREVHRLDRLAGLSELALGIAHEIKNPLNGVMGFAALLSRSEDPAAMKRFAGKVVQGVAQVDGIVKALLGFARPERQRGRAASVGEAVAEAAAASGLPSVRVQVLGARELRADGDALARVLTNLFRNAIEAAPAVRLVVTARSFGGQLELDVQDDGPGVPAHVGDKVFEPFVSSKERGTGLGLPLCLRVLSFLGGSLELRNPGEVGACFRVRLPLLEAPAAVAAEPIAAEPLATAEAMA